MAFKRRKRERRNEYLVPHADPKRPVPVCANQRQIETREEQYLYQPRFSISRIQDIANPYHQITGEYEAEWYRTEFGPPYNSQEEIDRYIDPLDNENELKHLQLEFHDTLHRLLNFIMFDLEHPFWEGRYAYTIGEAWLPDWHHGAYGESNQCLSKRCGLASRVNIEGKASGENIGAFSAYSVSKLQLGVDIHLFHISPAGIRDLRSSYEHYEPVVEQWFSLHPRARWGMQDVKGPRPFLFSFEYDGRCT